MEKDAAMEEPNSRGMCEQAEYNEAPGGEVHNFHSSVHYRG